MDISNEDFKYNSDEEREDSGEDEEETAFNELNDIEEFNDIEKSENPYGKNDQSSSGNENEVRFRRYGTGNYRRNPNYFSVEVRRNVNEAEAAKRNRRGYINGNKPSYETDKLKYIKNDTHDMMEIYLMPVRCYTCGNILYQEEIEKIIRSGESLKEYVEIHYIRDCCKMRIYSSPFVIWLLEDYQNNENKINRLNGGDNDELRLNINNTGQGESIKSKIISDELLNNIPSYQQGLILDLSLILSSEDDILNS